MDFTFTPAEEKLRQVATLFEQQEWGNFQMKQVAASTGPRYIEV